LFERRGDVVRRSGDVDRAVRPLGRIAARAVADDQVDVLDAGGVEVALSLLGELRLALDAPHLAAKTGEHRGVVARARADVEHLLVAGELEHLAHPRDDHGLRDGLPGADRQRRVLPCETGECRRDEQVPGNGRNRRQHPLVPDERPDLLYEALSRGG
jgi:hypothetical protein